MVVRDMNSERFVQFRKSIDSVGLGGIETHFPLAPWSQRYFTGGIELLNGRGIAFDLVTGRSEQPTAELVHVDFGSNVTEATAWTRDVFTKVFGCPELRVSVRAEGIDPLGSKVTRKDHPRPAEIFFKK